MISRLPFRVNYIVFLFIAHGVNYTVGWYIGKLGIGRLGEGHTTGGWVFRCPERIPNPRARPHPSVEPIRCAPGSRRARRRSPATSTTRPASSRWPAGCVPSSAIYSLRLHFFHQDFSCNPGGIPSVQSVRPEDAFSISCSRRTSCSFLHWSIISGPIISLN